MTDLFEGRTVITREPAYLTEAFGKKLPKPRLVSGVNECLLSDETTIFECSEGDFASTDVDRVIRHRSKHADSERKYPPAVLAKVMKYRELERAKGVRGWAERVAARLNKEKVPRPDGSRWFASTVSSLAQAHVSEYELNAIGKALDGVVGVAAVTALVTSPDTPKVIEAMTNRARALKIAANLAQARALLTEIAEMEAVFSGCDHDDYDELKAKAANFDQLSDNFKRLMG